MPPSPMLHEATLSYLKTRKNLLAFSGGGDSTALFFLLLEHNIPFDIAHVNYQTRPQSDDEEAYAKTLAHTHQKQIFVFTCKLEASNFEHEARLMRYDFFERVIREKNYNTLLSAHHLNDTLEWFLMQLCKGAGLVELLGMSEYEEKKDYTLLRPLLHVKKADLLSYLSKLSIPHFEDESNTDIHYLRNRFRHAISNPLIDMYAEGISKSFSFLEADKSLLIHRAYQCVEDLCLIERKEDDLLNIRAIDHTLKRLGTVLSTSQRDEILKTKECVVGGKFAVCFTPKTIFIAPYVTLTMPKVFKEACRKARIPSKIRPYMYRFSIAPDALNLDHTL